MPQLKRIVTYTALLIVLMPANTALAMDIYGGPPSPQPSLQPAYRAEELLESLGLSADPFAVGTLYPPESFFDLGIRYYRMCLKNDLTPPDAPKRVVAAYEKYGARPMLLIDNHKDGDPASVVTLLKQYPPGVIAEVEGPNELNNKFPPQQLNMRYKGKTDEAAGAAYMDDYYGAIKADPETKDIPVVAFTAIFTDYRLAKPHNSFDFSNMHSYAGQDIPSSSLEVNITRFNNILPVGGVTKPFVPTECGYNVEEDVANHTGLTGSLSVQAKNIPMLYAEYFRHGLRRTYLFALQNTDGYGLLESDQKTRRPSYFMVRNFVAALKDAAWNPEKKKWEVSDFRPQALLFDLEGPSTVHTLTVQKSSGEYSLLIWNEIENFDGVRKQDRNNPPVPVTLSFRSAMKKQAAVLTQNAKGDYDGSILELDANKLKLQVPSSVQIVGLNLAAKASQATLSAPEKLEGQASELQAHIEWQTTPNALGYFVFRNGWHIATVMGSGKTEFTDTSSYLRPGLGYTYAVQAFDAAGNMSPRAERVVQTEPKFPDMIIVDFGAQKPAIQPGDKVRFTAKLKNAGAGCTPQNISVSATWSVDGKVAGWGGRSGPIKPGEEFSATSDGGPDNGEWTASAGTHTLACHIDDINRLPGEFKGNNLAEQTFVVGEAPKGMLNGSSHVAPGAVNLTREGTMDWIHWGLKDKGSVTRKAGGGNLFSELTQEGPGHFDATSGCPNGITWTDGAPEQEVHETHAGVWWNNAGTSVSFTVPADTKARVLKLYVAGIEGAGGSLTASLSDNSAPAFVSKLWNGNTGNGDWAPIPDQFNAVYEIHFRAALPNQKLTIKWSLASDPNPFNAQCRMQAATLAQDP
jgi:hypothetical protein